MGAHSIKDLASAEAEREFVRRVLQDVQALELMIAAGAIESGVRRIGAEQEVFLIDRLQSPQFTTELALFNLEINVPPVLLEECCLSGMAATLKTLLARVRAAALVRSRASPNLPFVSRVLAPSHSLVSFPDLGARSSATPAPTAAPTRNPDNVT